MQRGRYTELPRRPVNPLQVHAHSEKERTMNRKISTGAIFISLTVAVSMVMLSTIPAWSWGKKTKDNRKTVAVYEVKSMVREVDPTPYTEFVTTTLIKKGKKVFRVLDRQQSVYAEKLLNQQGMTTGDAAQSQLIGACFIFVVTITEANAQASKSGAAGTYKGVGIESSGEKAEIGVDISVQDAKTAEVLDSVHVTKKLSEGGFSATGLGNLFKKNKKLKGLNLGVSKDKKTGIDKAIMAAIEDAIGQIVSGYEPEDEGEGEKCGEEEEE